MKELLKKWKFSLDDFKTSKEVSIPHTWNIEEGTETYLGLGKYKYEIFIPKYWEEKELRLLFKAVYRDTRVFLNGVKIGEHFNSGYTPFYVKMDNVKYGDTNEILVEVDNSYSETALPYDVLFDWSNDGGITRDVFLLVDNKLYIEDVFIDAKPIIFNYGEKNKFGKGILGVRVNLNKSADSLIRYTIYKGNKSTAQICSFEKTITEKSHKFEDKLLDDIEFWHFDNPVLYTVKVELIVDEKLSCTKEYNIGFREFKTEGHKFVLNGEYVRLCGTEWMPGSNPDFGMAETKEELEKWLILLKETNCVYTRFHWQQDDFVFDWCNRHGILVQEEIPYWGPKPKGPTEQQFNVFKEQIEETIRAHYNHPSIIAWAVGNELEAREDETVHYIKKAVGYTKTIDKTRLVNYVSNSFTDNQLKDGTCFGDILMINEYIGTWNGAKDVNAEISKMVDKNLFRPIVPSEFGLCEPKFSGGDERRIKIFNEKMECYSSFDAIAGTINFSLNDFRTHMGEDGEGKLKKRIHGSVDIWKNKKPSYEIIQKGCSPIEIIRENGIYIYVRNNLPSYEIEGYSAHIFEDDILVEKIKLPLLKPGEKFKLWHRDAKVSIYRKNNDFVGTYE